MLRLMIHVMDTPELGNVNRWGRCAFAMYMILVIWLEINLSGIQITSHISSSILETHWMIKT